ncbi:MAG: hypothetical protein H7255_09630 [Ramlibacter sp.]|nr:hypothetical protein [Ramlibacter sp.]
MSMIAETLALATAIIVADQAPLRAAPRDSAQQQAQLWQGELVEVRGERLDYLQVYDHKRERAGFVKATQVRRTTGKPAEAPELLGIVRFVRDTPGSEALGLGFAAAYIQAATAEALRGDEGLEVFDAMGAMADRLAHRASFGANLSKSAQATLAAHLEVASRYGSTFKTYEREGRMQICYEGEAFRRVMAMNAKPEQTARAALALTRPECVDPALQPTQRAQVEQWRADVLDRVQVASLPGYLKNRVQTRRASVWSTLAFQQARQGKPADGAAQRALSELAGVNKSELTDVDQPAYAEAAMRTNASRWAAIPAMASIDAKLPSIITAAGQAGETCVMLVDAKSDAARPLAKRCTYSVVWTQSASLNREGNALALAVQPIDGWRELWVFRKRAGAWSIDILPPAATSPDVGYAEFAGWVPGGQQMLVAREAQGEGKYKRAFEVISLDSLATQRQSGDVSALGPFQRWQDASWRKNSVALR